MTVTDRLQTGTRWAAAEVLERLPLIFLGDGSPLIALTALVVGVISAWPADNHPPWLSSHGGPLEVYAWVVALFAGAGLIAWGLASRQWRVQVAGLMLAGTGLTVYGIAFALASGTDSAAVGVPPMVLGVGAAIRLVIVSALGVTWEARTGANDGGREGDGGD
jgi:hypothetical protein